MPMSYIIIFISYEHGTTRTTLGKNRGTELCPTRLVVTEFLKIQIKEVKHGGGREQYE